MASNIHTTTRDIALFRTRADAPERRGVARAAIALAASSDRPWIERRPAAVQ